MKRLASAILLLVALSALLAPAIAPYGYDEEFRETISAQPSRQFLMGTDEAGRDRFSRMLYATRTSLLLAPGAAFVSVALALAAVLIGPRWAISSLATICLSLPWLFLFIILRAELPLDTTPAVSVGLTFGLMGIAGWAWPARIFAGSLREIRASQWLLQARAAGVTPWRAGVAYIWPHLRSLAAAQFRVLVPVYILSEASLGLLGLGVANPLPSWGSMLKDLQDPYLVQTNRFVLLPLGLLMLVMICLEISTPEAAE